MGKDYYKILGVEKGASKDEIKSAFRKKAHQLHPDKGGDAEQFKEANEAYHVLIDDQKRGQYDQFGTTFDSNGAGAGGFGNFGGFGQGVRFEDLGDIFGDLFGGGFGTQSRHARGQDIEVDVNLSFKDSVFGVEKEINVTKNNACERCAGSGAEPTTAMKTCADCHGEGVKIVMQRTMFGNIQSRVMCENCHGSGEVPEKKCTTCDGSGYEYGRKTLRVEIPAGIEDGMKIRVRGQGEAMGANGATGDLYLRIHVKNDPRFEREGKDIYLVRKIGFTQAALGDEIKVDTVDGQATLKIPAGTQSGDKLRMRGKGVSSNRNRGDQIVIIHVATPKNLSRKQKKVLEELDLKE